MQLGTFQVAVGQFEYREAEKSIEYPMVVAPNRLIAKTERFLEPIFAGLLPIKRFDSSLDTRHAVEKNNAPGSRLRGDQ